ncbi:MAG: TolC family protein [Bacteroidetes bacterium]|nr:TolC family protein [Bacteroidota bacterium]
MKFTLAKKYFFFILSFSVLSVSAQETANKLSLDDVIKLARDQSPEALLAKHRFRASYWQYRTYKAEFLPSLTLATTLPDLNRSISKITMPDGTDAFVDRKLINTSAELSLSQNVPFTGGSFFVKSGLQRIDLLNDSAPTSFLSSPVSIGYNQPLITFNSFKWEKKIEPLRYEEAKKRYIASLEDVTLKAVSYFFDLALAQLNLKIAKVNFSNNDTLYKISKGRYELGKIAENDLLQMEYTLLNSDAELNQARLDLEVKKFKLRSYLGFNDKMNFDLDIPSQVPSLQIEVTKASEEANKNNPEIFQYDRQMIESERDMAKAKAESRFSANLYASYGLSQSADDFGNVYKSPKDQERVMVGIQVPIIDWGLAKGKYKMAQSAFEVTKVTINQAKIDFEQDLFLKVMQFNMQKKQVGISAKADTISQNRYDVAKQRYYIGKIDVTALNIALTDKDVAKRNYISALRNYWNYFYNIRRVTLFDFEKNNTLSAEFDKLIE